jgi:hypothetical protein
MIAAQVKHGCSSFVDANDVKGRALSRLSAPQACEASISELLVIGSGEIGAFGGGVGSTKIAFLTVTSPGLDL